MDKEVLTKEDVIAILDTPVWYHKRLFVAPNGLEFCIKFTNKTEFDFVINNKYLVHDILDWQCHIEDNNNKRTKVVKDLVLECLCENVVVYGSGYFIALNGAYKVIEQGVKNYE